MYNKCRSFHEAGGRFNSYQVRPRGHMKTAWNNYHFIIYWVWYKRHFTVYMWVDLSASDWSWSWPWCFCRFDKNRLSAQRDLDTLKNAYTHGDPVPRFHYENRTFSMVKCVRIRHHPHAEIQRRSERVDETQWRTVQRLHMLFFFVSIHSRYMYVLTVVCMCLAGHVQSWAIMIWKLLSCAALTIICLKVTRLTESYLYFMK